MPTVYTSVCTVPILRKASAIGMACKSCEMSQLNPGSERIPSPFPSSQTSTLCSPLSWHLWAWVSHLCLGDPMWQVRIFAVSVITLKRVLFKGLSMFICVS